MSADRRNKLIEFVNGEDSEVDHEFMDLFHVIVANIGPKVHPKLLELVVKIGINFAQEDDDAFWFALIDCTDFGLTFNTPHLVELLLNQVLLKNENSWKAMCLLCVFLLDYSSVKQLLVNSIMYNVGEITKMFNPVTDYTTCCYLVELVSQLSSQVVSKALFPGYSFPFGAYANDERCKEFLDHFCTDPSIHKFSYLEIDSSSQSSSSSCQVHKLWFVIFVDHDGVSAPIEIPRHDIINVQLYGSSVQFEVDTPSTKSLINFDISSGSKVKITLESNRDAVQLYQDLSNSTVTSPLPYRRKISVSENFIKVVTTKDNDQELSDADTVIEDCPVEVAPGTKVWPVFGLNNEPSEIEQTDSLFGSNHASTTKDTTHCSKRVQPIHVIPFEPKVAGKLSSSEEPTAQTKHVAKPSVLTLKDIWDFSSDLGSTASAKTDKHYTKAHTIKFEIENCKKIKKSNIQRKLEDASTSGKTNPDIVIPDSQGFEFYSQMTSPIMSLRHRVNSRALSKAKVEKPSVVKSGGPAADRNLTTFDGDSYKSTQGESPVRRSRPKSIEKISNIGKAKMTLKPIEHKYTASGTDTRQLRSKNVTGLTFLPDAESTNVENLVETPGEDRAITDGNVAQCGGAIDLRAIDNHTGQLNNNSCLGDLEYTNELLSEAYTVTLQNEIYKSVNIFSDDLVSKIRLINEEINKKVTNDLTHKYERIFEDLKTSFQKDVDEVCGFVNAVKGLLCLPEKELVEYIRQRTTDHH